MCTFSFARLGNFTFAVDLHAYCLRGGKCMGAQISGEHCEESTDRAQGLRSLHLLDDARGDVSRC